VPTRSSLRARHGAAHQSAYVDAVELVAAELTDATARTQIPAPCKTTLSQKPQFRALVIAHLRGSRQGMENSGFVLRLGSIRPQVGRSATTIQNDLGRSSLGRCPATITFWGHLNERQAGIPSNFSAKGTLKAGHGLSELRVHKKPYRRPQVCGDRVGTL
jgi:hypothetical protein